MYLLVYLAVYLRLKYSALMEYYRATMARNSGRGNWYAYCTVPKALRSILKKTKMRKSLGTSDSRIARQRLRDVESEFYKQFDRADIANHPLPTAYLALNAAVRESTITGYKDSKPIDPMDLQQLFDPELRWNWFEEIRDQAGLILASTGVDYGDDEEAAVVAGIAERVEPLLHDFSVEFRKVSSEDYAPKKRSILFKYIADKYFASYEYNTLLTREKTKDDYRSSIDKFMRWAGDVDLSAFAGQEGVLFMNAYADEMVNNREIIPIFRGDTPSAATLQRHFSAVHSVLSFAKNEGFIEESLWDNYKKVANRKAQATVKPIAFSEAQILQLLRAKKKPREQLLFQLAIGTGCRLDELALLTWGQVVSKVIAGVEVFALDFTSLDIKVKRAASHRVVPLVPDVFACLPPRNKSPFSCKKEPDRLFDYPRIKDGKTDAASKAGMRQIRKLFKDPRLVNHSFRHYFTNKTREAEQYLPKAAVNYITGHSIGAGERDEYGDGYPLKMTYEAMCKLDFSFLRQD